MKVKERDPYSFVCAQVEEQDLLSHEEKQIIEKKVFVERRYQTSRKIRDNNPRNKAKAMTSSSSSSSSHLQVQSLHTNMTEKPEELIVKPEPMDAEYYEADYSSIMGDDGSSSSSQLQMQIPDYSSFLKTEMTEEEHESDHHQELRRAEAEASIPSAKQRKMNEPFRHSEK